MTPERWQKIDEIFHAALEHDSSVRAGFLDRACAGDPELRSDIEALLLSHSQGSSFLAPALDVAARWGADEALRFTAGQRVGPYELIALIGAGGMGQVWRARDPSLNREVAIKTLSSKYSRDPDRLERFEREARAAGSLNHPNVLTVHA